MSEFKNYSYIFYDLETTGQNPCFDQVVRFAAKETDSNLNIINEHNISIQLRNDVLPHPKALLVNKLNIGDLKEGLVEYEAFSQIHQIMNQPNTINIGYNSLNFDDIFLRFGFYRNLLDPYSHQYGNKFRADLYNIIFMYYLYKNEESIVWPMINNRLSLRLEQINSINNLYEGMSHDAEVDVHVTIELAKKLYSVDNKMWDYLISNFIKKNEKNNFNRLPAIKCVNNQKYKIKDSNAVFDDIDVDTMITLDNYWDNFEIYPRMNPSNKESTSLLLPYISIKLDNKRIIRKTIMLTNSVITILIGSSIYNAI